jgi:hypothetical protein
MFLQSLGKCHTRMHRGPRGARAARAPSSDLSGFGPLLMIAELNKASAIEGLGKTHGLIVSIAKTQNYVSLRITFC